MDRQLVFNQLGVELQPTLHNDEFKRAKRVNGTSESNLSAKLFC